MNEIQREKARCVWVNATKRHAFLHLCFDQAFELQLDSEIVLIHVPKLFLVRIVEFVASQHDAICHRVNK